MPTDNEQSWMNQYRPFSTKVGGLFSGPGRQLYDISTHAPIQEAAKYPLLFGALSNLVQGRNTNAFNPIENRAREQFQTNTIPTIAQRFAGQGDTAASSGFMGELGKAATDLESGLAAERAKFGQEEERLRQSGLEQLLKFGMQPTSEKILMQKPEGEIPATFEKLFTEEYGPRAAEIYEESKNWANQRLKEIEGTEPEARTLAQKGILKAGELGKAIGAPIEKGIKRILTPARRGAAQAQAATEDWSKSEASKKYKSRVAGSKQAEQFKDANQQREIDEIMDIAGVQKASDLLLFNPKNKRTLKKPLSFEGLQKFNELAHNPAFTSNDPIVKDVLKYMRDEEDINRMLMYFTLENPNRKLIPSPLRKNNKFWRDVYNKKLPTPRRGK